jgi:hypothetical protein
MLSPRSCGNRQNDVGEGGDYRNFYKKSQHT